jgi:CheY-like chemotaxis protein
MAQVRILWADDEIDLLKPHVLFLEQKGYEVVTVNNGADAAEQAAEQHFDIVFLDENMPGLSGLETLQKVKENDATLPVIMITKSEEEHIMEEAIGSKISDYLIKPVNPNQILLSIKKNLDKNRLVSEKTSSGYQREFQQIGMQLMNRLDVYEWTDLYKKLVYWDLELDGSEDKGMAEVFSMQKNDANNQFVRFIKDNYTDWLKGDEDAPVMSHTLLKDKLKPIVEGSGDKPVFMFVIDNLRYDQWKTLQPKIGELFRIEEESMYYSILPTATQYARNAIFAGLMPSEIERLYPHLWKHEHEDGGKNNHEDELLAHNLKRMGLDVKFAYNKVTNLNAGRKLLDNFNELRGNKLNVIVYNFVDMLSHARTEMEVIKELADDASAYRSLTQSWFDHSPLLDMMREVAEMGADVVITTDHGTVRVEDPVKVVGDRNTNSNLRYKLGRNLDYNPKEVFEVDEPRDAFLPRVNVSTRYIFAEGRDFFVYPNNYNHYVNYFKHTFQHGGISMEEVLIPFISLSSR